MGQLRRAALSPESLDERTVDIESRGGSNGELFRAEPAEEALNRDSSLRDHEPDSPFLGSEHEGIPVALDTAVRMRLRTKLESLLDGPAQWDCVHGL